MLADGAWLFANLIFPMFDLSNVHFVDCSTDPNFFLQ